MVGRRIAYLAALVISFVFYCFYREWFAWLTLMAMVFLPLLSLVLSLPAMALTRVSLYCPGQVRTGVPARITLRREGVLPPPPVRSKVKLHNSLTGERFTGYPGEHVPTGHCGLVTVSCKKLYIYDYLGLFRFPLRGSRACQVWVLPKPMPGQLPPAAEQLTVTDWKPKAGGGPAEEHDLRLYRPGDNLRQIHWKLSAKTGKLIYREGMEPARKGYLLQLALSGSPEELDRKLGRLLWTSQRLLEGGQAHGIRCLTGSGLLELTVTDEASQAAALCRLLEGPAAEGEPVPGEQEALWQCCIGGGPDA